MTGHSAARQRWEMAIAGVLFVAGLGAALPGHGTPLLSARRICSGKIAYNVSLPARFMYGSDTNHFPVELDSNVERRHLLNRQTDCVPSRYAYGGVLYGYRAGQLPGR